MDEAHWAGIESPGFSVVVFRDQDSLHEGYGGVRGRTNDEGRANARLISAAPDLLAALKELLPEGWGDDETMDHIPGVAKARAAIAKAEGTTP